ncbi:hypothetical protein [Rufibacter immobilis]|uniref:hypothetical protein n=1 Tax=Rufibacter immobilis TaxID=1348778 RepID=UPI00161F0DD6|nr:hypothetical protein [Rufibacter immobilis]
MMRFKSRSFLLSVLARLLTFAGLFMILTKDDNVYLALSLIFTGGLLNLAPWIRKRLLS